jgi:hypothetical protein
MAAVRLVGALAAGVGTIMLVLTAITALLLLFVSGGGDLSQFVRGAVAVMSALVMASTMVSCGTVLGRVRMLTSLDSEALRLNWTALFAVMMAGGVLNLWFVPVLSVIAACILLALLLVRGAVIRLTSR